MPLFLNQLVTTLRGAQGEINPEISRSAVLHGHDLLRQGFTVSQVVHDHGDICQTITELALEQDAPISTDDFRTLNRCLDDAIAGAVTEFGRGRNQSILDGADARGHERLGFFAHELRNLLNTSILAFEVLQTGNVGVGGSTGKLLKRNLLGARNLIGSSLAEVRLTQGIQNPEHVVVAGFIDEIAQAASLEADERNVTFTVLPVEEGVAIEADRQILSSVIANLLQNAFKFTRRRTTVTLRVGASADPGKPPTCSARSTSEARIEGVWVSRTAGGPSKRIADGSMRAPSKAAGACLRWSSRGPRFLPSPAHSHLGRVSWKSACKRQQTSAIAFRRARGWLWMRS